MMLEVDVEGGGGWRARNAGTMTKNKSTANGIMTRRWGSRHMKE